MALVENAMAAASTVAIPEPLPVKPPSANFKDPCSFSNPAEVLTQHIHIDLNIDLQNRLLTAVATLKFRIIDPNATAVILDTRGLAISSVVNASGTCSALPYKWLEQSAAAGNAIAVDIPPNVDDIFSVKIAYSTDGLGAPPAGGACDWLSPEQCGGRPFVFTQAQAIHARSIFPCQDTPAAKAPYSALVTLDESSRDLQIVMSAQRIESLETDPLGSARFECKVPIPSYLFAFAVGRLSFRDLSNRCRVWALPEVVERAAWEFEDVELFLSTAEKIAGPYVWGRYDLLVLPFSFPFGGMENPMLTFVTPTLLSGDRSLVSVVIHEIAHSWAGNLVSCQDSRHFWVNEGFTVKLERRILRELYGTGQEGLDAIAGRQALNGFVDSVGSNHKCTTLVSQIAEGEDPDDYFSCVSYEKGYNLLLLLEQHVLRDYNADFHDFLKKYFDRFRYQAINSQHFEDMFRECFPESWKKVNFEEWLHGSGGCPELGEVDTSLVEEARQLADDWVTLLNDLKDGDDAALSQAVQGKFGQHGEQFNGWNAKQQLCLLSSLGARILTGDEPEEGVWTERSARALQEVYNFNGLRNSEMRFWWCRLALAAGYADIIENVSEFLRSQGRMKFVCPLFKDLHKTFPKGDLARQLFEELKPSYHSIASKLIERDLAGH